LKCDRLRVHKNFMLSLVIRYLVSVVYYEPYIYGQENPQVWFKELGQGKACKFILVLLMYGYVAPIFWMFIEGVYLHARLVTNVFDKPAPFKLYYFVGWVLPFIFVSTWATTMSLTLAAATTSSSSLALSCGATSTADLLDSNSSTSVALNDNNNASAARIIVECSDYDDANSDCWEGYNDQPYAYILSVPMTAALTVNLLFLINILRIVVSTVQQRSCNSTGPSAAAPSPALGATSSASGPADTVQIKKAVRATLILFPLLGITNLLFFINPKNGTHDKIYMLFNASMQSSQGIFLAILYCFCNSEVQDTIKRKMHRRLVTNEARRATSVRLSVSRQNSRRATRTRSATSVQMDPEDVRLARTTKLLRSAKESKRVSNSMKGVTRASTTLDAEQKTLTGKITRV